jgi:hypothetical protein
VQVDDRYRARRMKADTPLRSIGQDRFDPSCLQSSVKYIQQRCKCRRGKASKHAAPIDE